MEFLHATLDSLWRKQGYAQCDGLRSLAMLWVCWFHAVSHFLNSTADIGPEVYSKWWSVAVPMAGDVGVELFLVLSGFLLGGTLFRGVMGSNTVSWWKFYFQRWVRISPAYVSTLLLSALIDLPHGSRGGCLRFWWAHLLFINNIYPYWESFPKPGHRHLPMCCIHTWSVAVEFQLYFATPPLFALAVHLSSRLPSLSPARAVVGLSVAAWLACCVLRLRSVFAVEEFRAPYPSTLHRMAPYFVGIVAGVIVGLHELGRPVLLKHGGLVCNSLILAAGAVLAVAAALGAEPGYFIENSGFGALYAEQLPTLARLHTALLRPVVSVAVAYLLVLALTDHAPWLSSLLSWPVWHPVAGLSYSMYLLQYAGSSLMMFPLLHWWLASVGNPTILFSSVTVHCLSVAAIAGTVPLAFLNYALVERPSILAGKRCLAMITDFFKQEKDAMDPQCPSKFEWRDDLSGMKMLVRTEAQAAADLTDSFPFGVWSMFQRRAD